MNDMISGLAGQIFQQTLENQTLKKPQTPEASGKPSFESYLQQDKTVQTGADGGVQPTTTTTSGSAMQSKLDKLEAELAERFKQTNQPQIKMNEMLPELFDSKSRLSLLKEAHSKMGNASKVANNLSGRLVQVESEYKQVESIMRSDKNLSPGELLALQARLYQVSQHIEVMSKVVDQMAGGIKTVLNTNV